MRFRPDTHARVSQVVRSKSHVAHMQSFALRDSESIVPPEEQLVIFEELFLKCVPNC